jgi:hypothetical protein
MDVVGLDTPSRDPERAGGDPSMATRPVEMLAAVCGVALVAAAQVIPWFRIHTVRSVVNPATVPPILSRSTITIIDAVGTLAVPYYLGWFAVFGLCGATAFGPVRIRRVWGPVGLGALAAQALVVLSILQSRGAPSVDAANISPGVIITQGPGAYLAAAALLVLGLAFVGSVAAEVRFLTARNVRSGLTAISRHLGTGTAAETALDDDEVPVAYGRVTAILDVGTPMEAAASRPVEAAATASDHSLYRRPIDDPRPSDYWAPDAPTHAVAQR